MSQSCTRWHSQINQLAQCDDPKRLILPVANSVSSKRVRVRLSATPEANPRSPGQLTTSPHHGCCHPVTLGHRLPSGRLSASDSRPASPARPRLLCTAAGGAASVPDSLQTWSRAPPPGQGQTDQDWMPLGGGGGGRRWLGTIQHSPQRRGGRQSVSKRRRPCVAPSRNNRPG